MVSLFLMAGATPAPIAGGGTFPVIPGWIISAPPVTYTPENLWDFIDGAAESYLAYSFVDLRVGEYVNAEGLAVRAELYRHADEDNAFGIYSMERSPDYSFLQAGAQGYEAAGVLNFFKARHYVKLSTRHKGPVAAAALRAIAAGIDTSLGGESRFPAGVSRLPLEGRVPNTERYIARDFLGYTFLQHAFTAMYEQGLLVFVIEYPSPESAEAAQRRLLEIAPALPTGPDRYALTDPNNGPIAITRIGALLCGAMGAADPGTGDRYLQRLDDFVRRH